jgi:type I restriction enzyme M protein
MGRSTVHYADSETNNILKRLHNKLRPAGTPVERVEYIIELLLLRIFEAKIKQDEIFTPLRKLFEGENYRLLFSHLLSLNGEQILSELNKNIFPFYSTILSKTRTVVSGNLPQRMQDQLVLMEEVFANSNFTNNVKGGVIAEVIGMVNEIDEKYILKTDLLGDAIESALSETGGTKDLGLHRTPDHIRQMMVEMVDPDFTDTIFDPTCGTAGFLFDAYEYVIEKARKTRQFPAEHIANMFYRTGIGGIEYQGRIRKMAAVNMYIRGLNPHNIDQGDSLKMFDPPRDAGSKTVVIANPPFGAERDQPAYPNIWEEYSKESETTILFVKLMFELLKVNGRCAVVVSEGFLTWGQNSACALRKILLNDANLRAIISLPQGVFVSKSGQGAKTSILYFEKGQPTDFLWYYKIENDGFSMGTNRKEIAGSQIPELLELFKEVKQGKKPRDTKHSFCVSKEQIETLDPRIAERIKKEVSEKTKEKNIKKRKKLLADLDKKLKDKKINKEMYDEKLWQFDNIIDGQIDNEVAKAIEKAHSYHFNLQNYRSNLSDEQIKDWQETLKGVEIKNGSKIEKKYQELQKTESKTALQILASFDPKNSLQMDIAREYLSKPDEKVLEQDKKFKKLEEILRKGVQYPNIELGELLIPKYEKIKKDDFQGDFDVVEKISFGDGKIHIREKRETGMDLYKVETGDLITSKINVHQGAIALSPSDIVCSTHYQIYSINQTEINTKYLLLVLRSEKFLEIVNIEKAGGIKNEAGAEFLRKFKIPLPPLEVQNEIVEKIEKQKQIIDGADRIEKNWKIQIDIPENAEKVLLKDITSYITDGTHKTPNYVPTGIPFISAQNIVDFRLDIENVKYIGNEEYEQYFKNKNLQKDDVLLAKSGTIGVSALFESSEKFAFYESLALIRPKQGKVIPKYLVNFLNSSYSNILTKQNQKGVGVQHLHLEDVRNFEILLPPLETQRQIVEKLDRQMQALEGVRVLKSEAEKRIEEILAEVWGK